MIQSLYAYCKQEKKAKPVGKGWGFFWYYTYECTHMCKTVRLLPDLKCSDAESKVRRVARAHEEGFAAPGPESAGLVRG